MKGGLARGRCAQVTHTRMKAIEKIIENNPRRNQRKNRKRKNNEEKNIFLKE
jgi:hypothetical protein